MSGKRRSERAVRAQKLPARAGLAPASFNRRSKAAMISAAERGTAAASRYRRRSGAP